MIGVARGGEGGTETGMERVRIPEDNRRAMLGQRGDPAY